MKKIFTLFLGIMFATAAMAQGIYKFTEAPTNGTQITSITGLTITISDDWKNSGEKPSISYGGEEFTFCTGGANNPSPKPETSVPTSGCFVKFDPAVAGTVVIVANINSGKPMYLYEDGVKASGFKVDGADKSNGSTLSASGACLVSFDVKANSSYIFAVNGSKLMAYGFGFEASGAIEETAPTVSIPASAAVLLGNEVSVSANIKGYPAPEVQWYSNTTASNEGGKLIAGATGATYKFTPSEAGSYYVYAVATNSKGSATSNVCEIVAKDPNIVVSETSSIIFTEDLIGQSLNGLNLIGGDLTLSISDPNNKAVVDAGSAYFGTQNAYARFTSRFKSGAKTEDGKLTLTLNSKTAGTLYVCARSASSSEEREISINGNSENLSDANAVDITTGEATNKAYTIFEFDIEEGDNTIELAAAINIYSISLDNPTAIKSATADKAANLSTKKTISNGNIIIITENGTFAVSGAKMK